MERPQTGARLCTGKYKAYRRCHENWRQRQEIQDVFATVLKSRCVQISLAGDAVNLEETG